MVVPVFDIPGYGAQFASLQAAGDQARSSSVEAQLGNYADVIRSLMANAKDIASVSGTPALDTLAARFGGGSGEQIFGSGYGGQMDDLRLQAMRADIAATNRSGMGGSGGGAKEKKGFMAEVTYPDGRIERVPVATGDLDQLPYLTTPANGQPAPTVRIVGNYGGEVLSEGGAAPSPAPVSTGTAADQTSAVTGAGAVGPAAGSSVTDTLIERINTDPEYSKGYSAARVGNKVHLTDKATGEVEVLDADDF